MWRIANPLPHILMVFANFVGICTGISQIPSLPKYRRGFVKIVQGFVKILEGFGILADTLNTGY
jgi:hypothetical protein